MELELWMPKLSHFINGNGWTGCMGRMEYEILPPDKGNMAVTVWYGPFHLTYAQMVQQASFPLGTEGVEELYQWLLAQGTEMNQNPQQSQADCLAYYQSCRAKEQKKDSE